MAVSGAGQDSAAIERAHQDDMIVRMLRGNLDAATCASSLSGLHDLARTVAAHVRPGTWLFLNGDLGAGKTAFASALAQAYGAPEGATSPTFSLLQILPVSAHADIRTLLHLDLYRIRSGRELLFLGLEEQFRANSSVGLFEWAERVAEDEWADFFQVTGCEAPIDIIELSIAHSESTADVGSREAQQVSRTYTFQRMNPAG